MRKALLITAIIITGCAVPPKYVGVDYPTQSPTYTTFQPPLINYNTAHLEQSLQDSMRESEKMKQFAFQSTNRQELINRIETFQASNRRLNELLQNPWNGYYLLMR
jgi:hypothetical protein